MQFVYSLLVCLLGYVVGSIPFGLLIVKAVKGVDVRQIGSGRIGGTNVMRAAGFLPGFLTGILDILKGILIGSLADWLVPGFLLVKVIALALVVWGQIHSIFLVEKDESGKIHLRGGAGGAAALGGAMALWMNSWMFIVPVGVFVFLVIGYASLTTISIAVVGLIIFATRYFLGQGPWEYILYSVIATICVLFALRPNLKRLIAGNERSVGLRAMLEKKKAQK
jgi:acyl phosphate:glycerol-3-phosphate acyltransferase